MHKHRGRLCKKLYCYENEQICTTINALHSDWSLVEIVPRLEAPTGTQVTCKQIVWASDELGGHWPVERYGTYMYGMRFGLCVKTRPSLSLRTAKCFHCDVPLDAYNNWLAGGGAERQYRGALHALSRGWIIVNNYSLGHTALRTDV